MKKIVSKIFSLLLIVFGIGLYLFPVVTTEYTKKNTEYEIKRMDEIYTDVEKSELFTTLDKFNKDIYTTDQKGLVDAWVIQKSPVELDGLKDNMFGYIEIPKMDVKLPLYIGASLKNMSKGAAVLGQTSFPIGGINTNSVIAAHRGYRGVPFFREIEKLEKGDFVYVTNPWEKLTYQVQEINIIDPYDVDSIKIQEGKDMITLLTCHPYRSHGKYRYVVYCTRVEDEKQTGDSVFIDKKVVFEPSEYDIEREEKVRKIAAIVIIISVVYVMIPKRKKKV